MRLRHPPPRQPISRPYVHVHFGGVLNRKNRLFGSWTLELLFGGREITIVKTYPPGRKSTWTHAEIRPPDPRESVAHMVG